ncbi:MAG: efflux RND transporter permease subunit [Porticoccaceae bacterium]|nr:efflux RND transporter permease subunit [Porticoccaceae bacterium]
MNFTDIFIRRPVLASVISLLILALGLRALSSLEVRQFPETRDTVVTITTSYPGASSELVKGFITTPLQQAISEADGIDYISSISSQGRSVIQAHMHLNYDPNAAVSEIQSKVGSKRNVLPEEAEDPVISSRTGGNTALMYISFSSETLSPSQINDYVVRVVQPQFQAVPGVSRAVPSGNKTYAMRIWLNPERMAALNIGAQQVTDMLKANNYLSGAGQVKGEYFAVDLSATTDIGNVEAFKKLVVSEQNGVLIYLEDVARVELGAEDYESLTLYQGVKAIFIGLEQTPGSNPLTVAKAVRKVYGNIAKDLPEGIMVDIPYDGSKYIEESIDEVLAGLIEAVVIVLLVILLSLGSFRAALLPAVSVPLSLVGAALLMLMLGYSLNLMTLLAMVLAIGLVVDDAIVVVENVHRHIELGETPYQAAILGARELGLPIIAMTTTLVAVYAPIGFLGGLVGTLFTEFAYSLAAAVLISGVVALTLAPMLASRVLKSKGTENRFEKLVEHFFEGLAHRYRKMLHWVLEYPSAIMLFAVLVLGSLYLMFALSQKQLAPDEDQSIIFFMGTGPQTATLEYSQIYNDELVDIFETYEEEYHHSFIYVGFENQPNVIFGGFAMNSTAERQRSQFEIHAEMQRKVSEIAGMETVLFARPSLPGTGGGLPIQFVVTSDADYAELDQIADELIGRAMGSGIFAFLQKGSTFSRPKATLVIDRKLAADLGISMQQIGRDLSSFLSDNDSNRFNLVGRSYKVIPQVDDASRLNVDKLDNYYIKTENGEQIPLSALVRIEKSVEPSKRTQFQQLNSLTVQGLMVPPNTIGDALAYLEEQAEELFPRGYHWDYTGPSRQFKQQGGALVGTFFMSILVIYLVLSAQFESWRDPLIILISVPLSIASALVFIMLGAATMNIYTQVGLITLIGLISKNGILIVQFANQMQVQEGLEKREALEQAAATRLRPILMTTIAMIMAMVPLLTATGPGAVSRFDIGVVIASGLGIGTLFTLFVVPAFYLILGKDHRADDSELKG